MKLSLSKRIERYLENKYPEWIHKGKIEELCKNATYLKKGKTCHYLAENGSRRCREMASGKDSAGKSIPITLEVKGEGNSVMYRFKKESKLPKPKVEIKDGVAVIYA